MKLTEHKHKTNPETFPSASWINDFSKQIAGATLRGFDMNSTGSLLSHTRCSLYFIFCSILIFFFFNSWKDCVVSFKPVPFGFCLIPSAENILRTTITGAQCSEHVHNDRLMNSHRVRGLGIHRAGRETWCSHHWHVLIISVLNPRGPKQITVTLLHPHPSPWVGLGWEDVKDPAGAQRTTAQGPNLAHHLVL